MTIIPIFLDSSPEYLRADGGRRTLLSTPVGACSLIRLLRDRISDLTDEATKIILLDANSSDARPDYGPGVELIDGLDDVTRNAEPSDWLLLVDARYAASDSEEYAALGENLKTAGEARYLAAMDSSNRGMREFVQFDEERRVKRIERLYDGVTWQRTRAVIAALIPVCAARECKGLRDVDIMQLRRELVSRGAVSRDRTARGVIYDLEHERDLLNFITEQLLLAAEEEKMPGFVRHAPGVWVSEDCRIHPTARLYSPVILHAGVRVDEAAVLIGPVLVGPNASVGAASVLAESMTLPDARIADGTTVRYRVTDGRSHERRGGGERREIASWAFTAAAGGGSPSSKSSQRLKQRAGLFLTAKRFVDVVISLIALIILSPVMFLTALAVKLTSHGPVFFCHEREGLNGAHFPCRKFRTMTADAHRRQRELYDANAVDGPQFKMDHDPRITAVGRFLRKTNLDELPQLLNVLRGQMSLIGPRPSPFRENQICVPWRETRLAVRPGITGLWQICRHERDAGDFHQWIEYDMLYVQHMSIMLDLKILGATLLTLGGRWSVPVSWIVPESKQYERIATVRRRSESKPQRETAAVS